MEIRNLANISHDELFEAFSSAFADYELQITKSELLTMLQRRGFDPKLSFTAFDGDKIVSFTCNGIGDFYGTPMAYDTGTGTLKDYRGQGLATQVFEYSIPFLKEAGINEYLLEVLQHNTGAVSVYQKIGFEIVREFYYFRPDIAQIKVHQKGINLSYDIKHIDINEYDYIVCNFWDFKPSWQNSFDAINRTTKDFTCLGVFVDDKIIAYSVFEPNSGDVTQIAVAKEYRQRGIGTMLFQKMLEMNKYDSIKIVNTDINCNSITAFLKSMNIEPTGKQYEMIKKL